MTATLVQIPPTTYAQYQVSFGRVTVLDDAGQPCLYCQTVEVEVEAQFYALTQDGQVTFGASCGPCLPAALEAAQVDSTQTVHVELTR